MKPSRIKKKGTQSLNPLPPALPRIRRTNTVELQEKIESYSLTTSKLLKKYKNSFKKLDSKKRLSIDVQSLDSKINEIETAIVTLKQTSTPSQAMPLQSLCHEENIRTLLDVQTELNRVEKRFISSHEHQLEAERERAQLRIEIEQISETISIAPPVSCNCAVF